MEDLKHRRDYWKRVLCRDGLIDLDGLHAALAAAISREAYPVDTRTLSELWQAQLDSADSRYLVELDGRMLAHPQLIYLRYSGFSVAIGASLGRSAADAEFADEWVTDAMRETRAILSGLRGVALAVVMELDGRAQADLGYSPALAQMRAANTGEPIEQAIARLHHEAKGLRAVDSAD